MALEPLKRADLTLDDTALALQKQYQRLEILLQKIDSLTLDNPETETKLARLEDEIAFREAKISELEGQLRKC